MRAYPGRLPTGSGVLTEYDGIVEYLLRRDLVSRERIVENDLVIVESSRRNCNVKTISKNGPCYFLKQEIRDTGMEHGRPATVAYEAAVYRLFETAFGGGQFHRYLARYHDYDPTESILILQAIPGSISLAEYYYRRKRFSSRVAGELGKALATLHRSSVTELERVREIIGFEPALPWMFFIFRNEPWLKLNSSTSNLEFTGILQASPELAGLFDEARDDWRASALIHGDLKWDNVLLLLDTASRRKPGLAIVDWELARIGDPCWDIGAIFSEYLNAWLSSIPLSSESGPDQYLALAGFPLSKMHPAIREFWAGYVRNGVSGPVEIQAQLLRATRYAGIRLVQSAYEQLQHESELTSKAICILQLCANILQRPMEAAVHLLGLPFPEPAYDRSQYD